MVGDDRLADKVKIKVVGDEEREGGRSPLRVEEIH